MSTATSKEAVAALLDGLSDLEVREMCIKALRQCHARQPNQVQLSMHGDLGREMLPMAAERKGVPTGDVNTLKEMFIEDLAEPWMGGVAEFVTWFVRAGFAWPLSRGRDANKFPITLHLTRSGVRFLELSEDHPLLPGFVDRIAKRCPGLPEDVLSLLVDTRTCLDHGLMRPAIVLMGVAYEVGIEHVVDALVTKGVLPASVQGAKAAARIAAIEAEIDKVLPGSTPAQRDNRFAAHAAYNFAERWPLT